MTDEAQGYVVLRFSEDGDIPTPREMTAAELRNALSQNFWGPSPSFATGGEDFSQFIGLLVIKGKIVQPQPHGRVVSWWVP